MPDDVTPNVQPPTIATARSTAHTESEKPISVDRLTQAFAEMLRTDPFPTGIAADGLQSPNLTAPESPSKGEGDLQVTPRSIVEAILFVGSPENEPLSRDQMASVLPGAEPRDIDELVGQLNGLYARDGAPYEIVARGAGYQMALRVEFHPVRDRMFGRARQARLSQAAIEVLAIVAYRQPVRAEEVNELRGTPSGPILVQLVRRQLLRMERPDPGPRIPQYSTTERFLRLFGLESLDDLPPSEDLDSRL